MQLHRLAQARGPEGMNSAITTTKTTIAKRHEEAPTDTAPDGVCGDASSRARVATLESAVVHLSVLLAIRGSAFKQQ